MPFSREDNLDVTDDINFKGSVNGLSIANSRLIISPWMVMVVLSCISLWPNKVLKDSTGILVILLAMAHFFLT